MTSSPAAQLASPPAAESGRTVGGGRRDIRWLAVAWLLVLIVGVGALIHFLTTDRGDHAELKSGSPSSFAGLRPQSTPLAQQGVEIAEASQPAVSTSAEVRALLKQAGAQVAAGQYNQALITVNRVRPLDPENPLAYLWIGQALLGKKDYPAARDFFAAAIDRDPVLPGAYFGYAVASEELGDLESALGGMRSYLHVETDKTIGRLPVAQARSAIWEWEAKLGRGPWGPTKGIPPGWTADEIKRDGKGTGVKMQKPETLRPDGTMDYEIKAGERFPGLWKK